MSASDPIGGNKFWFNGIPYNGISKSGTNTTGVKYWFNGLPVSTLIPTGGVTPPTTTYAAFGTPQTDGEVVTQMIGI